MSVHFADGIIRLEGNCTVEQAEKLLQALQQAPDGPVDVTEMTGAHLAVVQILLAARPRLIGPPDNDFLDAFVLGGLTKGRT